MQAINLIPKCLQALLFYLPVLVWRSMNARAGIDLNSIVEAGETFQNAEKLEGRDNMLKFMTKQVDRSVLVKISSQ